MNTIIIALTSATFLTLACGAEPMPGPSGGAGAGSVATAGSNGQFTAGQAGASPFGGAGAGGGSAGGSAGASSGASSGGGLTGSGGSGTSGSGPGAGSGTGGSPSGGAGGSAGVGGSDAMSNIAKALDGIRVDDACAGTTADTSIGAICLHAMLTASGGFKGTKQATIAGTAGTTYDVTLRIRGVVEPTEIVGGVRSDASTFQYRGLDWRTMPYTIGGAVSQTTTAPDYTQWHIGVASPKADFYLNDYQKLGHYIFKLDYQITIQVAANSVVTLDGTDRNDHQIVNYEKYVIDGIAGSMNNGQFVQINVVSVKLH